jgi:hypothetical protein
MLLATATFFTTAKLASPGNRLVFVAECKEQTLADEISKLVRSFHAKIATN